MRHAARFTLLGALVLLVPVALEAQGTAGRTGSSAGTGGSGGQARGAGARGSAPTTPPLPNRKAVTSGTNPADYLVDKRKKLKLDDATVASLKELSAQLDERYAPGLTKYDSLRTQVNMARNQTRAALPSAEEQQIARERAIVLGRTMAEVRAQRAKDVEETLALVPEEHREAAKAALEEQAAEMARTFRRSGPEGAAAAGGPARRP
jgi:hypothetical protein